MYGCPTCGRSFRSRRGLGVHHSSVHAERLPNRTCDRCGERFFSNYEKRYCSEDCLDAAVSLEGHPNWAGDTDANYGRGWRRVRERALERDDHRCVICGTTKEELGRNPDVHHVVPVRAFVETPVTTERDAHHLGNVVSLCIDCHRRAEFGHVSRERLEAAV